MSFLKKEFVKATRRSEVVSGVVKPPLGLVWSGEGVYALTVHCFGSVTAWDAPIVCLCDCLHTIVTSIETINKRLLMSTY